MYIVLSDKGDGLCMFSSRNELKFHIQVEIGWSYDKLIFMQYWQASLPGNHGETTAAQSHWVSLTNHGYYIKYIRINLSRSVRGRRGGHEEFQITACFKKNDPISNNYIQTTKMRYSYKTNYKLLSSPPVLLTIIINALCALHLLHGQHQHDSWIRPKRVWECLLSQTLLQPWFCLWAHPSQRVMVEHKQVILHIS